MSGEAFDPSIIVFAALAVFVLWRLSSVLGMRTGRDPAPGYVQRRGPAPLPGAPPVEAPPVPPVTDRWKGLAEPQSPAWAGLDAVAGADPSFSGKDFVEGGRRAYEIIVEAFSKGDRDTLRNLLSKEVFKNFEGVIAGREARGETEETAVVSIDAVTVEAARADKRSAEIALRFVSRLITVRRGKEGEEIENASGGAERVVDIWTFARDPHSADPNWKLVATRTGE